MNFRRTELNRIAFALPAIGALLTGLLISANAQITTPILFVTQTPQAADFTTIGSTFGNHQATLRSAPRGGDLWIRYADGELRNLTQEAGFGMEGFQGEDAIAVRDPSVHWDGDKAVFSMIIGAPSRQYEVKTYYWQLYEITGFGKGETIAITKVPSQPEDYNNVSPTYGTDDRIIFTSDRPHGGRRHLYPLLDEYEEAPTVSGLWNLDPATGDLFMMNHTPSGAFTPTVDSYGRVIFTRWDHLQRDQQADSDETGGTAFGTFDYSDESADAERLFGVRHEVFPEPRAERTDLLAGTNLEGHRFNLFFPWMIHEDGTEEETLNHIGRHELHRYFNRTLNDDPNVVEFIAQTTGRNNPNSIEGLFHIKEDPTQPGLYYSVNAPEFATHTSGQIVTLNGPPGLSADDMMITYITHPETALPSNDPTADHSGLYRDPLPLSDGSVVAAHTAETRADRNDGNRAFPTTRYHYRIKQLTQNGDHWEPGLDLTGEITESLTWYDPDFLVTYDGPLWAWQPVEVRSRTRPTRLESVVQAPEQAVFTEEDVDVAQMRTFLEQNDLALIVSRNVTTRDQADTQQPMNLRVAGGGVSTVSSTGKEYEISHLELYQADHLRGIRLYNEDSTPRAGRRVLARELHDSKALQYMPEEEAFPGAVKISPDGSMAAFVPARRAMSWQLTDPQGTPVVRERYWLTFQPGEIRTCASCHGLNTEDQIGQSTPMNKPEALRLLLRNWKQKTAPRKRLRGRIAHAFNLNIPVRGVKMRLLNGTSEEDSSVGEDGSFDLGALEGGTVTIRPYLPEHDTPASGVDVVDIVNLRKHILSRERFAEAVQSIAADVNRDESIDVRDIVAVRKVILGLKNHFGDSDTEPEDLWRFLRRGHQFNDPLNPFAELAGNDLNERTYNSVDADIDDQDFLAIKLGDVNGSWTPPTGN